MSLPSLRSAPVTPNADFDQGPRGAVILMLASIVIFLVIGVVWMYYASLDISVHAAGKVVPSSKVQQIQSLEGGLLRELNVKEGQTVHKGDLLARIENLEFNSELGETHQTYWATLAALARLDSELGKKPLKFPAEVIKNAPEFVSREQELARERRAELEVSQDALRLQLDQRKQELQEGHSKVGSLTDNLSLAQEIFSIEKKLFDQGAGARADLLAAQQKVTAIQGELRVATLSLPRLESAVRESEARLREVETRSRAEASGQRSELQAKAAALAEILTSKRDRVSRRELRAPMDGVVNRVLLNTVGGVAKAGESIMEIVPIEDKLLVSARVQPADVAFIKPGQSAQVRISAYDFSVFGAIPGSVVRVGADALVDEKAPQQPTYFEVLIETERNYVGKPEEKLTISPGMTADSSIQTGQRTILEYMLKPIVKTFNKALRER